MLHCRVINALLVLCASALVLQEPWQLAEAAQARGARAADESRRTDHASVRVCAFPFKTSEGAATVVLSVEADAATLGLPASASRYKRPLEVTWTATDERGGSHTGTAYDGSITIDTAAWEKASRHGVRILSELDLPPGRYQLRVTVRSARTESAGSTLTVPDFTDPLTMGGVALSPVLAAQPVTFPPEGDFRVMLPVLPTSRREFETGETIGLFTEVYESRLRLDRSPARATPGYIGDHTTHLVLELRDEAGGILQTMAADHSMDRGRAGSHRFVARLPLDVPPGRYVIRLKARANIGDPDTATRDIQIRVRQRP